MIKIKKYYSILLLTLVFSLFSSSTESPVLFETLSSVQAAEQKPKNFLERGLEEEFVGTKAKENKNLAKKKRVKKKKRINTKKKNKKIKQKKTTEEKKIESTNQGEERTYVVNTRSKKFHLPSCHTIKRMSAKNRKDLTTVRDELIHSGYSPCKVCRP